MTGQQAVAIAKRSLLRSGPRDGLRVEEVDYDPWRVVLSWVESTTPVRRVERTFYVLRAA
jgi:hypothetical protein